MRERCAFNVGIIVNLGAVKTVKSFLLISKFQEELPTSLSANFFLFWVADLA